MQLELMSCIYRKAVTPLRYKAQGFLVDFGVKLLIIEIEVGLGEFSIGDEPSVQQCSVCL